MKAEKFQFPGHSGGMLDDADHLLQKDRDAEYAACVLAAWAARCLPETPGR